jgi:RNA polymerase sigma-70 factor (ECF subfamily)
MGDEKIIAKIQAGETEYFSSIYDSYIDSIYRYVYLKTSVKEVAEDITSDVFLSALKNISRFKLRE